MELINGKVIFNKAGGTSVGGVSGKVSIRKSILEAMGITPEERNIEIVFDEKSKEIKIKKSQILH